MSAVENLGPDRPSEVGAARARRAGAAPFRVVIDRARRIDARTTWPVAVGALLVPLGLAVILFAWYGSAHTPYIQQQIPYLVSGSFIGLGMMILGGLMYWAHWLYRVYDQANLHHTLEMEHQEILIGRLIEAVLARPAAVGNPAVTEPAVHAGQPTSSAVIGGLVATATGSNAHRPDCPIVRRHPEGVRRLSTEQAAAARLCRICNVSVSG